MSGKQLAIARAVAMIGGTTALIIGATFAASWSSTATLTNNTFSSQTADLQLSLYNDNAISHSIDGYTFVLKPGDSDAYPVRLYNKGTAKLGVTLQIPNFDLTGSNINSGEVTVKVYANHDGSGGSPIAIALLSNLASHNVIVGDLDAGAVADYSVVFTSTNNAINGIGGTTSSLPFNLEFTGTATH